MKNETVLLGMSGGMDSACAVTVLRNAGYDVRGAVLAMHSYSDTEGALDAAAALGIDLITVNCAADFTREVCGPFSSEYALGRTPNPCIICNERVKFAKLIEEADRQGIEKIATGHYAGIERLENGRYCVTKARDAKKDQSYMLWRLSQETLSRTVFPLHLHIKTDLREDARKMGLAAADKPESQEICFIPDGDYAAYIENALGVSFPEGDICDTDGNVIGTHKGLIRYTVGQRKGIGAYGKPMFVKKIDAANNRLILGASGDEYEDTLEADGLIFSGAVPFDGTIECEVKHRYHAPAAPCTVTVKDGVATAHLHTPARAITPGQSAVFYDGDRILFGGFIK
ncbi:MAG: tRNA 2-thiouridine(34) synthase MnmA [Clostridia bacterium]|nr:tRNA 2-thiouridine(34) synthase MnmA [Clostridia bacterium]